MEIQKNNDSTDKTTLAMEQKNGNIEGDTHPLHELNHFKEKLTNLDQTINIYEEKLKSPKPTFFVPLMLLAAAVPIMFVFPFVGLVIAGVSFSSYLYQNEKKLDYRKQKDELKESILARDQMLQPQEPSSNKNKTQNSSPVLSQTTPYNNTHQAKTRIL